MGTNRRANAVLFGFDFQVNAAIVLMIENITDLNEIRLESNNEDIDITLNSGNHILAQAKAIEKSSSDFTNVRKNLKKSLESLSEGNSKVKADKLILITNSPNPLNDDNSRSIFYGHAHRDFSTLPQSSQNIINEYLEKINQPLNTDLFRIQVLPFETDDENERYKVVLQEINDFIGNLKLQTPGLGKELHQIWKNQIFVNGSKKDETIFLNKKDIIWPAIVISTDIEKMGNDFEDYCDEFDFDEIVRQYKDIINYCSERFEFFTQIMYDFNNYRCVDGNKGFKNRMISFLNEKWTNYSYLFNESNVGVNMIEGVSKAILFTIIKKRYEIDRIKQGVNL